MANLSWLSGLVSEDEGSIKLLNGTNLSFSGSEILLSNGPATNILHEFDVSTYASGHYIIHAECGANQRETINATVVAKDDGASITIYGRVNTGVNLINVQADIDQGLLKIFVNPAVEGLQNVRVTSFATLAQSIVESFSKATVYYYVKTDNVPKFLITAGLYSSDSSAPILTFFKGLVYRLDQSDPSNDQDPLIIGTVANDANSSVDTGISYYLDNKAVTKSTYLNDFQTSSTRYIEISVGNNYPDTLFYFSNNRTNLGNQISIVETSDTGSSGGGSSGGGGGTGGTISGANQELSNLGVTAINSSLVPAVDSSIDLGSSFSKWKDLYLSGNSLILGNATITSSGSSINLPAGTTVGGQPIGGGGGGGGGFSIIRVPGQSEIDSITSNSILNFAAGSNISLSTNPFTGTIIISSSSSGGGGSGTTSNSFSNISVPGQAPVIADQPEQTLTLIAGPNISLTTNPAGDAITISASSSGGGTASGVSSGQANRLAYYATSGAVIQDAGPNLEWNGTFLQIVGTTYITGQKNYIRQYWDTLGDLNIEAPPNIWRGMIAYSGDIGRVYYAHNNSWNRLARFDELPTIPNSFRIVNAGGETIEASSSNTSLSILGGVGIDISADPETNSILITNTGGGSGGDGTFGIEDAQDAAAAMFITGQHTGITFTYDDFNNRLNATVSATAGIYTDEQAQDAAASLFSTGVHNGITFTYDDAANSLSASIFNDNAREYIQDQAAALLTSGSHTNITFVYDDLNNRINATAGQTSVAFTQLTEVTQANITIDDIYSQASTKLTVTNSGASAYLFSQYTGNNPTLYVTAGTTIAFKLNASGHPFLIQTAVGVNITSGLVHCSTSGVTSVDASAQSKDSGTLYWRIPENTTGFFRYQCSLHSGMRGDIHVVSNKLENISTLTGSTGVVPHDFNKNLVWLHSNIAANFTANFTNVPASTTQSQAINFTLILLQGLTGYLPNAVQIDGVSQTINWQDNQTPTPSANKKEIVSFSLIRNGVTWIVLGSLSSYG